MFHCCSQSSDVKSSNKTTIGLQHFLDFLRNFLTLLRGQGLEAIEFEFGQSDIRIASNISLILSKNLDHRSLQIDVFLLRYANRCVAQITRRTFKPEKRTKALTNEIVARPTSISFDNASNAGRLQRCGHEA